MLYTCPYMQAILHKAITIQESALLSKKLHLTYQMAERQLSKQAHYDFTTLRSILSVLRTVASQKPQFPNLPESTLLMRCIRDMNFTKCAKLLPQQCCTLHTSLDCVCCDASVLCRAG